VAGSDFADGVVLTNSMRAETNQLASFDEALAKFSNKVRLLVD
jgi:hypothetical protein